MKLNSLHIVETERQYGGRALPENHPALGRLTSLFGDHTFFLDTNGLTILEPATEDDEAAFERDVAAGRVVELASWADETRSSLLPHAREATDFLVVLDPRR